MINHHIKYNLFSSYKCHLFLNIFFKIIIDIYTFSKSLNKSFQFLNFCPFETLFSIRNKNITENFTVLRLVETRSYGLRPRWISHTSTSGPYTLIFTASYNCLLSLKYIFQKYPYCISIALVFSFKCKDLNWPKILENFPEPF
jgi:hypothetical protein